MAPKKIKVLVADDHAVVRQGLKQIISDTEGMTVVDEAQDGQGVLDKIKSTEVDVVLMDLAMPGKSGLDVLHQLRDIRPDLPVLILSMYPEEDHEMRMLKAGASGYLTKESAPEKLIDAIRKVFKGERFISPYLSNKLAFALEEDPQAKPHERLTEREFQIMCKIAQGKTVSEIAGELALSAKTISAHRANILEKMFIKNNVQLAHYALKHGLID